MLVHLLKFPPEKEGLEYEHLKIKGSPWIREEKREMKGDGDVGREGGCWDGEKDVGGKCGQGQGDGEICRTRAGGVRRAPSPAGKGSGAFSITRINGSVPKGERDGKSHARLWAATESSTWEPCTHLPPQATSRGSSEHCYHSCDTTGTRNQGQLCQGIAPLLTLL